MGRRTQPASAERRAPGWLIATCAAAAVRFATTGDPRAAQSGPRKKLLFLAHNAFYAHSSLGPAERAVAELGPQGGFDVTALEGYKQQADKIDLSMISAAYLDQFDGS
jgi:hypothetical protein